MSPVWDVTKGSENVIVGVLDTGIDISHPELKDSIYVNQKEIPGNGVDDDQNGYIDDVNGWDFINSDNTVYDNSEEDSHGTHIAGIIAAKHDDQGVKGIAPGVKILPLKFLNSYDGFTSDAIEAIRYAKKMGVKVINCSFGDTYYNYALEKEMRDSGILFICSSGNDTESLDNSPAYPASFAIPNKITVAAINNKGKLCEFSNYGNMVDIAAPGEDIISTIPEGKYEYDSGTSMAAPFVTATAALLWSYNYSDSVSKIKDKILNNTKKLDGLTGKIRTGGMVNAYLAFEPGWEKKADMIVGREEFAAVACNEKIYAIGGHDNTVEEYNPDTDTWTMKATLPGVGQRISAVELAGKIYVIGGKYSNQLCVYDPISNTWTIKRSSFHQTEAAASVAYKGKIYVTGGANGNNTMEVYDPMNDTWETKANMNFGRWFHCLEILNEKMYAIGGDGTFNSIEEYDFEKNTWTVKPYLSFTVSNAGCAVMNGKLFIAGDTWNGDRFLEYNPLDNTCKSLSKMNTSRNKLSLVALNNKLFAIGGSGSSSSMKVVEAYSLPTESPVETPTPTAIITPLPEESPVLSPTTTAPANTLTPEVTSTAIGNPTPTLSPTMTPMPTITPTTIPSVTPTNTPTATPSGNYVKGKVYIPGNGVAKENINIEVFMQNEKEKVYSTTVEIKEGSSSAEYSLYTPNVSSQVKYQIGYYIHEGGSIYAQNGLYASSGTVFDEDYAEDLTIGSNLEGIDIDLLVKRKISGTISLPAGKNAPSGGLEVEIAAGTIETRYYTDFVKIPEGQTSTTFEITAFENNRENKYIVGYDLYDAAGYLSGGFYNTKGTTTQDAAEPIDISTSDASNINLTILPGKTISGTVSLPESRVAPKGGILVEVSAESQDVNESYYDMVTIEEGKNSIGYSIVVPDNNNTYYLCYYTLANGYVREGYYHAGSTTASFKGADLVSIPGSSITNKDLTLITGGMIKGWINLPNGYVAPQGGTKVRVFAEGSSTYIYTYVTIKAGEQSAEYSLSLPQSNGLDYYLGYYTEQKGLVNRAYYSYSSTTIFRSGASKFAINQGSEQYANFYLITGTEISGVIRLPSGTAPSGGIAGAVFTCRNDDIGVIEPFIIPSGCSYVTYTITVPYGDYSVGYLLDEENPLYYDIGFYGGENAPYISAGYSNISNINMTIEPKTTTGNNTGEGQNGGQTNAGGGNPGNIPVGAGGVPAAATTAVSPSATPASTPSLSPAASPVNKPAPTVKVEEPVQKLPSIGDFKDVAGHWALKYIGILLDEGILAGYDDKTIKPDQQISRVEAVSMICKAIGLKPAQDIKMGFADKTDIPKWAAGYIQAAVDMGILKGYPDNTLRPNKKITRAEVTALVMNAFKFGSSTKPVRAFKDEKGIEPWSKGYISKACEIGVINGYKDNTFKPKNNISRAETFVIIANCLKKK